MEEIQIRELKPSEPDYEQVLALRNELLRKPIGLSLYDEDLTGDAADVTLCALHQNNVIGCLMLQWAGGGAEVKLRQMAIAAAWQAKGIGRKLMLAAEDYCRNKGIARIVLHARVTAIPFYEKLGYSVMSGEFTEVGIAHKKMEKQTG